MSEWVTGQPAVSGYFLKLFICYLSSLSFILRFSDFLRRLVGKVWGFSECEQLTCQNAVELQPTVRCLVEERRSVVEHAPLRAA